MTSANQVTQRGAMVNGNVALDDTVLCGPGWRTSCPSRSMSQLGRRLRCYPVYGTLLLHRQAENGLAIKYLGGAAQSPVHSASYLFSAVRHGPQTPSEGPDPRGFFCFWPSNA